MSLVHLKNKNNGVAYVSESTGYWDKEKQQARNHRKCIGKLDPVTDELISSKKNENEDNESSLPIKRRPLPSVSCQINFYRATYIFDAIADKLGITEDLKQCFPVTYMQILSIAYYLILEDRNPMSG